MSISTLQPTQWVFNLLPTPGQTNVPDPVAAPASAATYRNGVRQVIVDGNNMRPLIRLADGDLSILQILTGELSCSEEELADETGTVEVEILYSNWLMDYITNQKMVVQDLNLLIDPHSTKPDWRTRWGGKVTEIHLSKDEKGRKTIKLKCLSFREHAKRLLVGSNPIFPPEIQLPRLWVLPGPCVSICAITSFINLARIFLPGWATVTNIFNPAAWINPIGIGGIENALPTEWPIQVAFVNPVFRPVAVDVHRGELDRHLA